MLERALAYSLSQIEDGWRWCVYDEHGVTVADGALPSRDAAEAAVEFDAEIAAMPHSGVQLSRDGW